MFILHFLTGANTFVTFTFTFLSSISNFFISTHSRWSKSDLKNYFFFGSLPYTFVSCFEVDSLFTSPDRVVSYSPDGLVHNWLMILYTARFDSLFCRRCVNLILLAQWFTIGLEQPTGQEQDSGVCPHSLFSLCWKEQVYESSMETVKLSFVHFLVSQNHSVVTKTWEQLIHQKLLKSSWSNSSPTDMFIVSIPSWSASLVQTSSLFVLCRRNIGTIHPSLSTYSVTLYCNLTTYTGTNA